MSLNGTQSALNSFESTPANRSSDFEFEIEIKNFRRELMKAIDEDSGQTGAGIRLLSVHPEGHRESSDCSLTMTTLNVRLGCSLRVFAWNVRFECSLRIRMKLNKFKTN